MSIISLVICIIFTSINFILVMDLESMPTALYLAEHKQLVDDWTTVPFVDV